MHAFRLGLAAALAAAALAPAGAQNPGLEFAEPLKLVSCEPASTVPCFRMKLNLVDGRGQPYNAQLPPPERLASAITVTMGGQPLKPFYASAAGESVAKVRGRAALIIVDISGSMKKVLPTGQTRFDAAKAAVRGFLDQFEEGADRIAIVPFESHLVEERIRSAAFARTRAAALAQVDQLPEPELRNNTALFSAVVFGIETLQRALPGIEKEMGESPEAMVIVLTDGNNEVLKGDDLGLLAGPAGMEEAARRVKQAPFPVIAIGFGEPGALDENALRQISTKYYLASDFDGLRRIFTFTRTFLNNRLAATFSSPYPDRASLAGQNLPVTVELALPNGQVLKSPEVQWSAPQMGVPVYAGKCTPEEMKAVLAALPVSAGWTSIIRPIGVFCGLALLLLVLWHWVPRLVWPEQYIGVMPGTGQTKWGSQTRIVNGVIAGRPAPPGFQKGPGGVAMPPRSAADATVVNPQAHRDFSQTRLGNRQGPGPREPF
ncbi:MAG: VWA domain-containing protein [Bryobacteraceae bacterium]|nr:VWA domain-containing protein [Bryobacteraceae bacterium]